MPTQVRSHAKINLGLGIGAPRPDGFHALATVYQTLALHDVVTVGAQTAGQTRITLASNDERVPTDDRNTAWRMVALALDALAITAEVAIHIEKRLPVQGGLGAGSANAAAALIGLETELGRRLPGAIRLEIAEKVGSDVPLFLIGGAVLGHDRGQQVSPLPDLPATWCVVAAPSIGVSTPQAFRDWDALCVQDSLTPAASMDKLKQLSRAYASAFSRAIPYGIAESIEDGLMEKDEQGAGSSGVLSFAENLAGPPGSALVRTGIPSCLENDFERVVFPQHPFLGTIKRILAAPATPEAALLASLSGSGSALFGLYQTREHAEAACRRLRLDGVASSLTRTLPRAAYWREMLQRERVDSRSEEQ